MRKLFVRGGSRGVEILGCSECLSFSVLFRGEILRPGRSTGCATPHNVLDGGTLSSSLLYRLLVNNLHRPLKRLPIRPLLGHIVLHIRTAVFLPVRFDLEIPHLDAMFHKLVVRILAFQRLSALLWFVPGCEGDGEPMACRVGAGSTVL